MKYRKNIQGVIRGSCVLYILVSSFGAISLNAQECQNLLETVNGRNPFPSERQAEYENCMRNLETEYASLISDQKNIGKEINNLNNDLNKTKNFFERAKQENDSSRMVSLAQKIKEINDSLLEKDSQQSTIRTKISSIKSTLLASYKKFINYCESDDNLNAKKIEYQNKLRELSGS